MGQLIHTEKPTLSRELSLDKRLPYSARVVALLLAMRAEAVTRMEVARTLFLPKETARRALLLLVSTGYATKVGHTYVASPYLSARADEESGVS
jgi:hypothetical protein